MTAGRADHTIYKVQKVNHAKNYEIFHNQTSLWTEGIDPPEPWSACENEASQGDSTGKSEMHTSITYLEIP